MSSATCLLHVPVVYRRSVRAVPSTAMSVDARILVFGDSFVAGVGDPSGRGWVGRVAAASHVAGRPLTAYNLGVQRDTSARVAARWAAELETRLAVAYDWTGVVLSFGANDAVLEGGRPRVPAGESAERLGALLADARTRGLDALVVGPPPVGDADADARVRDLSRRYAAVAAEHGVPFVETFAPLSASATWRGEAAAGDGAHPGAGGYAALARVVLSSGWLAWLP